MSFCKLSNDVLVSAGSILVRKIFTKNRSNVHYFLTDFKNECWDVLSSIGSNKSPRNHGLSQEFYTCFFDEIHNYLLESLNYSFSHGQLSHSQCQAMITLTERKGKDKRFLKNWRPISLINVDAKIASRCLALRIRNVLSSLIHSDQTTNVKDR